MPGMVDTLTIRTAAHLATIITWAQRGARVRWLTHGGKTDTGVVRSIGDERGNFLRDDEDVRDAFVRITTAAGWEWFPPVREVLDLLVHGEIVEDR